MIHGTIKTVRGWGGIEMTMKEAKEKIESRGLKEHHTSYIRVYASRKPDKDGNFGYGYFYNGRFGAGIAVISPNLNSTQYSFITYYVA